MASPPHAPAAPTRRETPRVRLARLASVAARTQAGVTGLDAGADGRYTTFAGAEALPGVVVIADDDGGRERYDLSLYLTASPTDLHALASALERGVHASAADAGLGDAISRVRVTFTDLTLPDQQPSR